MNLKDRKALLQRELLWAKVRDVEEEVEQDSFSMEEIEKKLDDCKQNALNRNGKILDLQEKIR